MKQGGTWLTARKGAHDRRGFFMLHRASFIVLVSTTVAGLVLAPGAEAEGPTEKPAAPQQIDTTPPLVPIPNAKVTQGGLLVGGQPSGAQLKAIQEAGYRTVINLRPESERGDEGEQAAVERMGMTFVSIPVAGAAGLTEDNARALGKALAAQDALPAVVHCSTGQRVAALLGLKAFVVDRMSATAAISMAKGLGLTKLEDALRERIAAICKRDKSRNCEGLP
ncbi:MAG TPA: sulfur transferase domain-containing protein [Polyangiales bacterium]|nr:sulfur transferase domain-containing protein [Polyangiales bacterium]